MCHPEAPLRPKCDAAEARRGARPFSLSAYHQGARDIKRASVARISLLIRLLETPRPGINESPRPATKKSDATSLPALSRDQRRVLSNRASLCSLSPDIIVTSFPGGEPPLARHHRPTPEWRSVSADPTSSSPSNFDLTERRSYSACFDRLSLPLLEDTFVACSLRIPRFKVYDIFLLFLLIFGDFLLIFF